MSLHQSFRNILGYPANLPKPSVEEKLTLERIHAQQADTEYDRDIARRRQGLQSLALSQQTLPPPLPALAARNLPSQIEVELDIITKAQARLKSLQTNERVAYNGQTITLPKRAPSARRLELQLAAAAGEDLRDSHRIKHEERSSDDEDEVQEELQVSIAAHNMFNPKDKKKTKTKAGYVLNEFVRHDSEEKQNDDDDDDEEPEDSDPDWTPGSSPTPSPRRKSSQSSVASDRKAEKKITQYELEELHKLRKHVQKQAMVIPELLATLSTRSQSHSGLELDTHGRLQETTSLESTTPPSRPFMELGMTSTTS